ncbi:hypothetical protein CHS0354_002949 [Potamilus streckersoni]|uniref:RING-type domain-containing protein n=1 Tax=Potamilus streckersoni TaxID=2493646 RepID=A0AAE0RS99_9BIVA|nr:hypothetical protein CHS0354_002949 [Potamilus streckersoni]
MDSPFFCKSVLDYCETRHIISISLTIKAVVTAICHLRVSTQPAGKFLITYQAGSDTMAEARDSKIKQLDCPICLETFISPKSLSCMHTFCEKCICKHVRDLSEGETKTTTFSCPVCRSPIPAPIKNENPQDWAAKLPNNSVVLSLSASKQADGDVPVYCEACLTLGERHISVAFCVVCSEYLCQTCYNCHRSFKTTKDHHITVHSAQERLLSNATQDAMYICQVHNEKLTYFCSEHKEICCMQCVIKDHRKCKQLLSSEGLGKNFTESQDFKQALENLNVLRKMFNLLSDNRTKTLETIEQQKSDVHKSIKDWSSLVKERVNKLETIIIQELEQICKEGTIIISDQIVESKSAIAAIETSQTMLIESTK